MTAVKLITKMFGLRAILKTRIVSNLETPKKDPSELKLIKKKNSPSGSQNRIRNRRPRTAPRRSYRIPIVR